MFVNNVFHSAPVAMKGKDNKDSDVEILGFEREESDDYNPPYYKDYEISVDPVINSYDEDYLRMQQEQEEERRRQEEQNLQIEQDFINACIITDLLL